MRILFVSHYFHPEVGAPQTRILEAGQHLSARGHQVTVITGFPNYPDGIIPPGYRGQIPRREWVGDIRVIRTPIYPAPNRGFARRLANHASFALSSLAFSSLAPEADVIVAETPPLFTAVSAVALARLRHVPLVLNVADLWPESAVQLGALSDPRAIALASALERFAYRHSALVTVPTPGMRRSLLDRGLPPDQVIHLPNAVDVERFAEPPARRQAKRVIYCGTVGMAQGVGTLIAAAEQLVHEEPALEFLIVGDGAERAELENQARERGLDRVHFAGRVDRERVPELIGSSDVAVLCLRDLPLFRDALPSKLLEYMAAGVPVVASAVGDVADLLDRAQAGIATPPGDARALAAGIRSLAQDPARARSLGEAGCRYVRAHYSRQAFVEALEGLIGAVAGEEGERARIQRVYGAYADNPSRRRAWSEANPGNRRMDADFYERLSGALHDAGCFPDSEHVLLDLGCGSGELLSWLLAQGAPVGSLMGVDLLDDRVAAARRRLGGVRVEVADARSLPFESASADAVVLATVLTSVLSQSDRRQVAAEAIRVLRPGGIIACYDVRWPNPANPSVRRTSRRELSQLFPRARIEAQTLTLLPPLARRLGPWTERLYGPLASISALRTHVLAIIHDPAGPHFPEAPQGG